MLDPISSVAFEIQAGKGVFALLLGSGVSRSAKIPTGWDVTLDLVRRVAVLKGEDAGGDPADWYYKTFGKLPDYSDLLDQLATTPALRQQVIRPYIEPSDDERTRGEKLPTPAHVAIAGLMAKGYVRVVLTTNFDQLLEQALAELGVKATVVSSADQTAGAVPLVHGGPAIIKLNGDYMDTRIRNTQSELSGYEPAIEKLLDQVLDEFGLIICGWSGEWDVALKAAINRAPSRRYPTIWTSHGEPSAAAKTLISHRQARTVPITGADSFFEELAQRVSAIESVQKPHPLSAEIAVAMMKEYLPEQKHQIRLQDLINAEVARTVERLEDRTFQTDLWSPDAFTKQVAQYRSSLDLLLPMAYIGGLWSSDQQGQLWISVVEMLARRRKGHSGVTVLLDLRVFPATLVLYAYCLGAVVGRRTQLIGPMVSTSVDFGDGIHCLGDRLNIAMVMSDGGPNRFKLLSAYQNKILAGSELIADILRPLTRNEQRDKVAFDTAFAQVELGLSLGCIERVLGNRDPFWAPPARIAFDKRLRESIINTWRKDYETKALQCEPCVMAALTKPPRLDELDSHLKLIGSRW